MKQVIIDETKFFNGYTQEEIDEIKILIANTKKFLDKNKLSKAASVLNIPQGWQYPELCMILITILTKMGNYKMALKAVKKMNLDKIVNREDYKDFFIFKEECIIGFQKKMEEINRNKLLNITETISSDEEDESFDTSVRIMNEFNKTQEEVEYSKNDNVQLENKEEELNNNINIDENNIVEPNIDALHEALENPDEINNIEKISEENEKKDLLSTIVTRLYASDITEDEIKKLDLEDFIQKILIIAYHEKTNKTYAADYVKKVKKLEVVSENKKIYNKLYEHLVNKKSFFNIEFYLDILGTKIDYELYQKLILKKQDEERKRQEELEETLKKASINNIPKKEAIKPKLEKVNPPIIKEDNLKIDEAVVHEKNITNKKVFEVKTKQVEGQVEHITIRKAFYDEVLAIKKYLYILMQDFDTQKEAVQAYDNFEIIIDKPVTDIEALKRFKKIVLDSNSQCDLNIEFNEEKFQRYIRR